MNVEDYLKDLEPAQLAEYKRIAKIVADIVPDATVEMSYKIPTWKYKGKYVLYFAAFKTHLSIYPVSPEFLDELKGRLGNFEITAETKKSAGTLQFSPENPVPEIIVREVIQRRVKQIEE